MKKLLFVLMVALAQLCWAQSSECDRGCCEVSGGTWDDTSLVCDDAGTSYYECAAGCVEPSGFNYSCCGPAFIMLGLVGAAIMKR